MIQFKKYYVSLFFAAILCSVLLAGCGDRTIEPLEENPGSFSVYGALALEKNPNFIRVKDLSQQFLTDSGRVLGATVIFEDLEEGTQSTLRDSVVEFSGEFTHNFIVDQNLEPDHRYLLRVEDPEGGETVSSMVETPAITEVSLNRSGEIPCERVIEFTFANVVRPERITIEAGFFYQDELFFRPINRRRQLEYREDADEMFIRASTNDFLIEVFPPPELGDPRVDQEELAPIFPCSALDSNIVIVRYIHFGANWESYDRTGIFDPTTSESINSGLGFLGALRRDSFTYTVVTTDLK